MLSRAARHLEATRDQNSCECSNHRNVAAPYVLRIPIGATPVPLDHNSSKFRNLPTTPYQRFGQKKLHASESPGEGADSRPYGDYNWGVADPAATSSVWRAGTESQTGGVAKLNIGQHGASKRSMWLNVRSDELRRAPRRSRRDIPGACREGFQDCS